MENKKETKVIAPKVHHPIVEGECGVLGCEKSSKLKDGGGIHPILSIPVCKFHLHDKEFNKMIEDAVPYMKWKLPNTERFRNKKSTN